VIKLAAKVGNTVARIMLEGVVAGCFLLTEAKMMFG